ncbi:hypothetical protein B566_EDAN016079 [Ephemera danica]|nr:hypothetical protein B566_EDAN016079 [Ephemera danica]
MLLISPLTLLAAIPSKFFMHHDVKSTVTNGEMFLFEHSTLSSHAMFVLSVKYITFLALRIFAPKLIFEAAGLGVSIVAVLLGFLFFSLVSHRLDRLMSKLQDEQEY